MPIFWEILKIFVHLVYYHHVLILKSGSHAVQWDWVLHENELPGANIFCTLSYRSPVVVDIIVCIHANLNHIVDKCTKRSQWKRWKVKNGINALWEQKCEISREIVNRFSLSEKEFVHDSLPKMPFWSISKKYLLHFCSSDVFFLDFSKLRFLSSFAISTQN